MCGPKQPHGKDPHVTEVREEGGSLQRVSKDDGRETHSMEGESCRGSTQTLPAPKPCLLPWKNQQTVSPTVVQTVFYHLLGHQMGSTAPPL